MEIYLLIDYSLLAKKNYSFKRSLLIWLIRKEVLNRILKDNLQKEYIYMVKPHLHLVKKTIVILISKHETLWFRKVVGVLNSFSKCLFWWIMDVHTHTYTTGGKNLLLASFYKRHMHTFTTNRQAQKTITAIGVYSARAEKTV